MVVRSSRNIMLLVAACMLPGLLASVILISPWLLFNCALALAIAFGAEAVCLRLQGIRSNQRLFDGSSAVTALIIALALPPDAGWPVLAFAVITAVGLGKYAYGGLGNNVFNPAMVGYAAALLSFPLALSTWPGSLDGMTGATALTVFKFRGGATVDDVWGVENAFGTLGGADSEWINAAFLLGGIAIIYLRLAAWRVSAGMLAAMALVAAAGWDNGSSASWGSPFYHWFTGATMLAAFFVVTDPVTHPASHRGQWLFGALVGALTVLIRTFGSQPDGIAFAVLLANAATPYLDRRFATVEVAVD
jgi:electron transport complex protein RnfD